MYIVGESVDGVNYTYSRGTDLLGYTSSLGETVYYRTNVHGDVKELVNVFGESLERYDYNAYGAEDEDYNPFRRMFGKKSVYNPFRYTGEYTDSETGLVYLRNRMYDPETGRFISEDPIRDGLNWYAYCEGNPIIRVDTTGLKDYIYKSKTEYYTENDWGEWEFLHQDRYYVEIDGVRYQANSLETISLYDWKSVDTQFLDKTLDSLIDAANEEKTDIKRIFSQSINGDLDFKLQLDESTLYLANGVLYNRNEAGNFVWAYFLESKRVSGYISGALAQGGSLLPPLAKMQGTPRLDESWDRDARWAGVKYYYDRHDYWWVYYALYGGKIKF